jgi:peroxiredoxin Q/BCP
VLKAGNIAPQFSLEGDDGQVHDLSAYRGQTVVLFFYPKDLTPGCTTEACDFTSLQPEFAKKSAVVFGISKDSLASHLRFKSKHGLSMVLLCDPDLEVHRKYFAWGGILAYGKSSLGVIRSTFVIDEEGIIKRAWYKVRVKNHAAAVLESLDKIK